MAFNFGAIASAFGGGGGGGGGGGTTDIFTPTTGAVSATNQGINFAPSATQQAAASLPLIAVISGVVIVAVLLLRRK